jgi:hypothetical protein
VNTELNAYLNGARNKARNNHVERSMKKASAAFALMDFPPFRAAPARTSTGGLAGGARAAALKPNIDSFIAAVESGNNLTPYPDAVSVARSADARLHAGG